MQRLFSILGLGLLLVTVPWPADAAPAPSTRAGLPAAYSSQGPTVVLDVPSIVDSVDGTVVSLFVSGPDSSQARGSGIIVDESGLILTNYHVITFGDGVANSESTTSPPTFARSITVNLPDGRSMLASVKGFDAETDIALLSVSPGDKPFPAAKLGNSDELRVGEWVIAIGNPFGLEHTVTLGIISAKGRFGFGGQYDDFLQTDAAINPGSSGGPLVNAKGEVIGISTLILEKGAGLSFAIPINLVREILPQLISTGRVARGAIGVETADVDALQRSSLQLPAERDGILVVRVERGTPAARAGLRQGDFITIVDKTPISKKAQFNRIVSRKSPGSAVNITFLRDGKEFTVKALVQAAAAESGPGAPGRKGDGGPAPTSRS